MGDAVKILAWLADGARSAITSEAVLAELCEGLGAIGVPLSRVAVFVRTLNPNNIGRRFIWRHDGGPVEILDGDFDLFNRDEYLNNPIAVVQREGRPIRRRLIDPNSPMDYPVLQEFKTGGITDYLASPLVSTDGLIHVATWSTTDPNGFSDENIHILESVVPLLARVAEIRALRRTVVTLLDTYVGHQSGERILAGRIRRGDSEMIRAVIWLSDLRGFTGMTDRLPGATVIAMLNRYFDCQIPPILERGGEVLKLIGDGLLAIFPVASKTEEAGVCNQALEAAQDFRRRVAALKDPAGDGSVERLRFGLALHIGELLYGNIGGGNRLDFTSIGPAINLAARLEKVSAELGCSVVVSADYARYCQGRLAPLGDFALKGFAQKVTAFSLPDEQEAEAAET
jgi:adenylate cyclase